MGTPGPRRCDPPGGEVRRRLSGLALCALVLTGAALPACTPRFDMTGEQATGDPVANKRVGQERKE